MLRCALFDLDDTLYPADNGLWAAMRNRMEEFIVDQLAIPPGQVSMLRERFYSQYGTTLNGLRAEMGVDAHAFLQFVHDVPLEDYIRPDPALNAMLSRLTLRKVIFTNADAPHARRVLARLGIASHFEQIVDILAQGFISKPDPRAYHHVLQVVGVSAAECVFIEDSLRNLRPAHELGMTTILVAPGGAPGADSADFVVNSLLEVEPILAAGAPAALRRPHN